MTLASGFAIAVLILVGVYVFFAVKTVPQGRAFTVERFGKYTRTLRPGLHFVAPIIDKIGHDVSLQDQFLDINSQEVITRDNAMVTVDGVVQFKIQDASKAAYEVDDFRAGIENLVRNNIRDVIGSMELDALLSSRNEISGSLLHAVEASVSPWGIKIYRVELQDIKPPADMLEAMTQQMKAEREKRAQVIEAEALRNAAFREAEARERLAQADAKAIHMLSRAVSQGDPKAMNYFIARDYVKALQTIGAADNSKLIMMPLESSNLIGSISGIAELTKTIMTGESGQPQAHSTPAPAAPTPQPTASLSAVSQQAILNAEAAALSPPPDAVSAGLIPPSVMAQQIPQPKDPAPPSGDKAPDGGGKA